ncbi:hypothetical protein BKA81DRAFT_372316 [Phyllosticta paracitricarpa]|uniref:Uncharacterized protein n=2 Tax=Phyllosticta TaxID=121621 RepID=A0ABR1LEE2_9PEZI
MTPSLTHFSMTHFVHSFFIHVYFLVLYHTYVRTCLTNQPTTRLVSFRVQLCFDVLCCALMCYAVLRV